MTASAAATGEADQDLLEQGVFRGDPFGIAHLEAHARTLAAQLRIAAHPAADDAFARRFADNAEELRRAYKIISASITDGEPITAEAEWLLDNFYVVEQQLWEIRDDLPRWFYLELPKLVGGEPRIYALALELIKHTDSALDEQTIVRFVQEFQVVSPLSIGEVWAVPIMLRLALIENLRRLAGQILLTRSCRERATALLAAWREHTDLPVNFSSLGRCAPLVMQILEQLREGNTGQSACLSRLERQMAEFGLSADDMVRYEQQRQAANQVSIGNVITSMRLITALDWVVFFERVCPAEHVLAKDTSGIYSQMDFETRDRYRHAVEEIAKRSGETDLSVAARAVALTQQAKPDEQLGQHVGYWLVDRGRTTLERSFHYRPRLRTRLRRQMTRYPNLTFLGPICLVTIAGALAAGWLAAASGAASGWAVAIGLLALVPASELAVGLTNFFVTLWVPPRLLSKLEFKSGVPAGCATIVVVPSMLTGRSTAQALLERLESHYLANHEAELRFALLTDWPDAPTESADGDAEVLQFAVEGIRALNERYGDSDAIGPFYLFHRRRLWNGNENAWMGWERKRGKLLEFNRLLRGDRTTSFSTVEGETAQLSDATGKSKIRFVITLDADTQLPFGAARRMIGALAHPLNRPRIDAEGRVIGGYTILQPRVSVHLASANRTWFARIFANSPGIDPYATAASDVYQDLFGEGSFTGKGIYDLEAFERTLERRLPENHILSHDLIEGCHARAGLVSDIELIDSFPARQDAEFRRHHRWVRGDWQLLPWLLRRVPTADGASRNRLSLLSRWKIFDNLRRSLLAPGISAFLVAGWLAAPLAALAWSLAGLAVLAFPLLVDATRALHGWKRGVPVLPQLRALGSRLGRSAAQTAALVALLPQAAYSMLDAIARTLWRLLVSRRRLLEWETAATVEWRLSSSPNRIAPSVLVAPAMAAGVLLVAPAAVLPSAGLWLAAWMLAPAIAFGLNLPANRKPATLSLDDRIWLRQIVRRTWAYFERYVGDDGHWLPPDNVQEYPEEKIAYRVSPTTEGLYLVSCLVARDFGFVGLHALADRWERNLKSWTSLDRFHGHFYNWYETSTLKPLHPRYISTVDSGNLAACFLTLHSGIESLRQAAVLSPPLWQGILDTVEMAEEALARVSAGSPRSERAVRGPLASALSSLKAELREPPQTTLAWGMLLDRLAPHAAKLRQLVYDMNEGSPAARSEVASKATAAAVWIESLAAEHHTLFGWRETIEPWLGSGADGSGPPKNLPFPTGSTEALDAWRRISERLLESFSLAALSQLSQQLKADLALLLQAEESAATGDPDPAAPPSGLVTLVQRLEQSSQAAVALDERFTSMAARMEALALEMDFRFLYNPQRRLFSIGYNLDEGVLDRSYYDMLCSEARIASYLAIAKGDAEPRHWFQLGRPMTQTAGEASLLSWGGTMFEYLMPPLFQRQYEQSLLARSYHAAVARQQEYGAQHGIPWGVSESAFGALAVNSDYHYRSFGVPGLGLQRGLAKDLVVSPYSTMLALCVAPQMACENLRALSKEGALGDWGFYDAIDYTPQRVALGKRSIMVRCFMAHHHGMSLLALANALLDNRICRHFHAHPLARSAELLLQERMPVALPRVQPHADEVTKVEVARQPADELVSRRIVGVDTGSPRTHLLSNGRLSMMVTSGGGGYTRWGDLAITRWRADATLDQYGEFIYLRELPSGRTWSAAYQPTLARPDSYEVIFSIDKAEFFRRDGEVETHLQMAVSPVNDVAVRELRLTNHGATLRQIEITSYSEVVLNTPSADQAHPAFGKLFVETEYIAEEAAILARRRPREAGQAPRYAIHVIAPPDGVPVEWETSRAQFLGRGRGPRHPAAMDLEFRLGGSIGAVLDPAFALRCTVQVPPHSSVSVSFATAMAGSREEALALADQYHDPRGAQRAFELAWAYSQVELRHLHLSPAQAQLFQRLASPLLYADRLFRGEAESMLANRQGQSGLWRYGISGDVPILLVRIARPDDLGLVKEMLAAHEYWRTHGLNVDLVILNEHPGSYLDALHDLLVAAISDSQRAGHEKLSGVSLLRASQIPVEDRALIDAAALVVLRAEHGPLARQLSARTTAVKAPPQQRWSLERLRTEIESLSQRMALDANGVSSGFPKKPAGRLGEKTVPSAPPGERLEFWNGQGGFAREGREYHIRLGPGQIPPAPWCNVMANPRFGCLVSEAGGGYTWFANSSANKLSTWSNDPTVDPPSEMLFVRDEEAAQTWPALPPPREQAECLVIHAQGYSRFRHRLNDVEHEVTLFVAKDDPVKFVRVRLKNRSAAPRRLSLTYYVEWVLGTTREATLLHLATSIDTRSGALLARNAYHPHLPNQVGFLHALGPNRSCSADRAEFLGVGGDPLQPAALKAQGLSGKTGPALDPCGAVQSRFALGPGESKDIVFLLGSSDDANQLQELLDRYATLDAVESAFDQNLRQWDDILGAVQVETPNRALDYLANRWLLYQTLSCRVWGRSAFYQSSGAFGFRDQLQDVMALVYSRPDLAREQLLRAASRQYEEGDVQHWWHPPDGQGTRTRFSDDLLWLPLVTCHYLRTTGDRQILDERMPFLHSLPLDAGEHERYELPAVSPKQGTLYEHCRRAVLRGCTSGPHGLPLIGGGDWNDGMNKIGPEGRGESVWVGWFLLVLLADFIPIVRQRGDEVDAQTLDGYARSLRAALEEHAWDGQWYLRAYFDDGTPLGSHENDECQIDSIAQSWAVLAGADPARTKIAIDHALARLVRPKEKLILLLDPPFDHTALDPGYIKGYLPGIRENGGQYTHSALWLIKALAKLGETEQAMSLFDLVNPVLHAANAADVQQYKVEPYVVAADVYSVPPHAGRGGWTWYTGSAAWMYRLILEDLLGMKLEGSRVRFAPCVPAAWTQWKIVLRKNQTTWRFVFRGGEPDGGTSSNPPQEYLLEEDGQEHEIEVQGHLASR